MGADLCSDVLYNSNSMFNQNQIKKQSLRGNNKSHNIKENVSIYSNSEQDINNKYFNNQTDVNNLRSSIFDNEENDHTKKYEQEINTYEHPYINNNLTDLNDSNDNKEYTFKNSLNNSNNKILDYKKSKEFITNNKNSFKRFEALKNKKNQKNEQICSFSKLDNVRLETNKKNNSSNDSEIDNINEKEKDNEFVLNEFINKDVANKKIHTFNTKAMNKFALNQLIKIQKRVRKSIVDKNLKLDNFQVNNCLPSLNIINSPNDSTLINNEKNFCVRYYKNGAIYIGRIKNNKCNGYGKYKTKEDDLIMGIFNNNFLHIYGIIERRKINSIFEGELQNNTFNGIGIESFKDGAIYYGQFYNNKKHGIGTYIWKDDSQYQGQWKNGEMNGLGIFSDDKGRNYEGSWIDGKMDGLGIFKWGDGRKYLGNFKNDKREGFGIYMWKNPLKIYTGFWKEGTQNGYGNIYTPFKEKSYLWNNGKINKSFNDNDDMIKEILKTNDISLKNKIQIFKMCFDDILTLLLDV